MHNLDINIIVFLNDLAHRSSLFDRAMVLLSTTNLLKGGLIIAVLWWLWFGRDELRAQSRATIISTLVSSFGALFVARIFALLLPFRLRPLHHPAIDFTPPYSMQPVVLEGWSSFPSDHAALFFTLAMGIFLVSREIGILVLSYVFVFICLPRVYLGLHFPTDIVAGALIGMIIAYIANTTKVKQLLSSYVLPWQSRYPGFFYTSFFLLTYQIVTLFDDTRTIGQFAIGILKNIEQSLK
jgi:undecaprenyl-diphosphatase